MVRSDFWVREKIRGQWRSLAVLVVAMQMQPAFAANLEVDFNATRDPATTNLLLAKVEGSAFDARLQFSPDGANNNNELQKCAVLADLAADEPTNVFSNAISTALAVELVFSESRDPTTFGNAWFEALSGFGREYGVVFEGLEHARDAIPIVQSLDFDISLEGEAKYRISTLLRQFIVSRMSDWLSREAGDQIDNFYESGIIRVSTQEQSIICGLLAFDSIEIVTNIRARVNDRVAKTAILDKECLERTTRLASAELFARNRGSLSDVPGDTTVALLLGAIIEDLASKGLFGDSAMRRYPPCAVRATGAHSMMDALARWSSIVPIWIASLRESPDGTLDKAASDRLLLEHQRTSVEATSAAYSYSLSLKVR